MDSQPFPYSRIRSHVGHLELPNDDQTCARHRAQEVRDRSDSEEIQALLTAENALAMEALAGACLKNGELERGIQAVALAAAVEPGYPEHGELTRQMREHLALALERMQRAETLLGADGKLLVLKLMTQGKLGQFSQAIEEGKAACAANPTWHTAIAAANAMRRAGDLEGAITYLRQASLLDSRDVSALLEIGDLFIHRDDWEKGLQAYDEALRRERNHPWAAPSAAYCRYRLHVEKKNLEKLRRMSRGNRDRCGAGDSLARLSGETAPSARQARARELLDRLKEGN